MLARVTPLSIWDWRLLFRERKAIREVSSTAAKFVPGVPPEPKSKSISISLPLILRVIFFYCIQCAAHIYGLDKRSQLKITRSTRMHILHGALFFPLVNINENCSPRAVLHIINGAVIRLEIDWNLDLSVASITHACKEVSVHEQHYLTHSG